MFLTCESPKMMMMTSSEGICGHDDGVIRMDIWHMMTSEGICDLMTAPLVINTNVLPILNCLRDIAFNRYIWLPHLLLTLTVVLYIIWPVCSGFLYKVLRLCVSVDDECICCGICKKWEHDRAVRGKELRPFKFHVWPRGVRVDHFSYPTRTR